nr:acetyltransferase [Chitinophagaceae bacterium]
MRKQLILIGGGGHCKSCIDVIELEDKFDIHGILDSPEKMDDQLLGYKYMGTDDDIEAFIEKGYYFLITIGQLKSAEKRKNIFDRLKEGNASIATIISPLAHVSKHAVISEGTIVMHGATVNADAMIGQNCILN